MKQWFVLSGARLRYYKDAKAEDSNTADGEIDIAMCYQVVEASVSRNYGFKLKVPLSFCSVSRVIVQCFLVQSGWD